MIDVSSALGNAKQMCDILAKTISKKYTDVAKFSKV